jgi:predicted metal-dependent hydrolase
MDNEITLYKRKIPYSIKKSLHAKRLRIAVYCNCDVIVTIPHHKTINDVESYLIEKSKWLMQKLEHYSKSSPLNDINFHSLSFQENKANAEKLALKIVNKYCKKYQFKYNKIFIKDHKTKWGSCSNKGNINLNYRIIFLPRKLAEYVIVHELCHLKELNHTNKYWKLVEKILPNYKQHLVELQNMY